MGENLDTSWAFCSATEGAVSVLLASTAEEKARRANEVASYWTSHNDRSIGTMLPPARPARPDRPPLLAPKDMPKRGTGGESGRIALLHAVAHIELNAIDLAFDLIARFHPELGDDRIEFISDWIRVGSEEAKHFLMLQARLAAHGSSYGDLPAHDGLWEAADSTRADLLGRLAVVPMVLEARGLDVTPGMIQRFERAGEHEAAATLRTIYADEIGHVEIGTKWFLRLCERQGRDPITAFKQLVSQYFKGNLKPPFNIDARTRAGLLPQFYQNSID